MKRDMPGHREGIGRNTGALLRIKKLIEIFNVKTIRKE